MPVTAIRRVFNNNIVKIKCYVVMTTAPCATTPAARLPPAACPGHLKKLKFFIGYLNL